MSSVATLRNAPSHGVWDRISRWLEATPHPHLAVEFSPDRVAAARWTRGNSLDGHAVEALPPGALVPSAVEANVVDAAALKSAIAGVLSRLRAKDEDVVLEIVGMGPATATPAEVK